MTEENIFQIEQKKLFNFLEYNYEFEGLIHATPFSNFLHILNDGYITGRANNIHNFTDVANQEVINITNNKVKECARFYFFKNTPTYYHFNASHPDDLVYLIFDWELFSFENAVIYEGNPSASCTIHMSTREYLLYNRNLVDWESVADREPLMLDSECSNLDFKEKREKIRKRNAELDIDGDVPIYYLKKIIFKSEVAAEAFISLLEYSGMASDNICNFIINKIFIDPSYF